MWGTRAAIVVGALICVAIAALLAPVAGAYGAVVSIALGLLLLTPGAVRHGRAMEAERRILAQQVEAMRDERDAAEAASRAKSDFLASISHEIRTPMNAIVGLTDLVLESRLKPDQRDYLEMVRASGDSLMRIFNDILDLAKIEAGKLVLERLEFSLGEVLGDTLKGFVPQATQKGVELILDVDPRAPDRLAGDPGRLRQVVVNLVGNALKFTERGEVAVAVERVDGSDDEALLQCAVRDTGIGIAASRCQAIFDAFTQAETSTTRRFGGTGLGLAISRQLVHLLGGRIWVDSVEGVGSTFSFTARFELTAMGGAAVPDPTLRDRSVLVVDDSETWRRVLSRLLSEAGMRPVAVADGYDALRALDEARRSGRPYAVALIDSSLEGISGYSLCETMRRSPTPTILLLCGMAAGDAERGRAAGAVACLRKPVKPAKVLETVANALQQRPDSVPDQPEVTPRASRIQASSHPMRVLLAEDNPINRVLAIALLERMGHRAETAATGLEALRVLEEQAFDAVLMDVHMPEMDGIEVTRRIRARERERGGHLAIVAMTAAAMDSDRRACLDAGMDAYVSKPLNTEHLFEILEGLQPATRSTVPLPVAGAYEAIDQEHFLERVQDNTATLQHMVQLFVEHFPPMLRGLGDAMERHDAETLASVAHDLKGTAGIFGARRTVELAKAIERMARDGDLTEARQKVELLCAEGDRVRDELLRLAGEFDQREARR